jgi:hypothetical protein
MNTRYYRSKIGRLPFAIRNELNERIRDGATGSDLLAWLNASKEFKAVMKAEKCGHLNAQNLTDWRNTGYADWMKDQGESDRIRSIAEKSMSLVAASGSDPSTVAARIAAASLIDLVATFDDPKQLNEASRSIAALRNAELSHEKNQLSRQKLSMDAESLALDQAKFQRSTCEMFIKWYNSKQARAIADDRSVDVTAKTEKLGQLMFGDLWDSTKTK